MEMKATEKLRAFFLSLVGSEDVVDRKHEAWEICLIPV
uniref:Uncharacterized protein n=1 Tax=Oryza sativa subsp. japonica TaxID=39947 RepID=Q10IM6_ORYSJ|nr:hypothetical protein LOC_Os03g33734 [Oryza sativa Japonica Group]